MAKIINNSDIIIKMFGFVHFSFPHILNIHTELLNIHSFGGVCGGILHLFSII